jgi:hypothetical protein
MLMQYPQLHLCYVAVTSFKKRRSYVGCGRQHPPNVAPDVIGPVFMDCGGMSWPSPGNLRRSWRRTWSALADLGRRRRSHAAARLAGATLQPGRSDHAVHSGRVVKRAGDGAIVEFRSVVDTVR